MAVDKVLFYIIIAVVFIAGVSVGSMLGNKVALDAMNLRMHSMESKQEEEISDLKEIVKDYVDKYDKVKAKIEYERRDYHMLMTEIEFLGANKETMKTLRRNEKERNENVTH